MTLVSQRYEITGEIAGYLPLSGADAPGLPGSGEDEGWKVITPPPKGKGLLQVLPVSM